MHALIATFLPLLDETPKDEDVVAGWVGFAVFIGLAIAVAVIGWALSRSLRKSRDTAEHGGYDPSDPKRTNQ